MASSQGPSGRLVITDRAGIGINMRDTSAFTANDGDFVQEDGGISGGTFAVEGRYTTSDPRFGFGSGLVVNGGLVFETFILSETRIDLLNTDNPQNGQAGLVWLIDGIATTFAPSLTGGDVSTFNLSGNETLQGAGFADTLFGGEGDDSLLGGGGDDDLSGDGGDDTILGGAGNDRIAGGAGANLIDGGSGADIVIFAGAFADYTVTRSGAGVTLTRGGESHAVLNVEAFQFTDGPRDFEDLFQPEPPTGPTGGDDVLNGTPGPDEIAALAGNDTVRGFAGEDTLLGQSGDDVLRGGGGDDLLKGGSGNDRLIGMGANDTVRGGSGDDLLKGGAGADRLVGMAGDDTLRGGVGDDFMAGGGGADRLIGGGGADTLRGGVGGDSLEGGGGADRILGQAGNDTIVGGAGPDTLIGGSGRDVFAFRANDGNDVIQDFELGLDRIGRLGSLDAFGQLALAQQGDHVLASYNGGSILLLNQNVEDLIAANDAGMIFV